MGLCGNEFKTWPMFEKSSQFFSVHVSRENPGSSLGIDSSLTKIIPLSSVESGISFSGICTVCLIGASDDDFLGVFAFGISAVF